VLNVQSAAAGAAVSLSAIDLFSALAQRQPADIAVMADDGHLTFAELDAASTRLAVGMAAAGAGPERILALCLKRGTELITAMLATWKAGSGFLLVDPRYPADRIAVMLAEAASLTVVEESTRDRCETAGSRCVSLGDLRSAGVRAVQVRSPDGRNVAYVIYTSGSTGSPKGVVVEQHSVALHAMGKLGRLLDRGPSGKRMLVAGAAPVSFDVFISQFLAMACLGHTLAILSENARLDPWTYHPATSGFPPFDVIDGSPSQIEALVQCGMLDWPQPPGFVLIGGETPSRGLWEALCEAPRTTAYNLYGATECTIDSTVCRADTPGTITIGKPYGGSTLYVLDKSLRPVAPGESGDLYIGGAGVSRGYLGRPRLTAESFVPDPFHGDTGARMYRTGDTGRMRPDGNLEFLGRNDQQVKIRGHRIECGEVESMVQSHPLVATAAVAAVGLRSGSTELFAFVTAADPGNADVARQVRDHLARALPGYLVPYRVMVVPKLPLGQTGKVDRVKLAELARLAPADSGQRTEAQPGNTWNAVIADD
jgi:amino acid adenylation domain-containing protein